MNNDNNENNENVKWKIMKIIIICENNNEIMIK